MQSSLTMEKMKKNFYNSHDDFKKSLENYEYYKKDANKFFTYFKAFLKSYEIFIENFICFIVEKVYQKYKIKVTEKNNMEKIKFIHKKTKFNSKEFKLLQELIKLRNMTVHEYDDIFNEKEKIVEEINHKTSKFDYLFENKKQRDLVIQEVDRMLPVLKKVANQKRTFQDIKEDTILPISLSDAVKAFAFAGLIGVGVVGVTAIIKKILKDK